MKLLKNYFSVFFICVFISIFAKLIFAFYDFADIEITEKLYAVFYGYKFDFAISAIIALLTLFFDFNQKLLLSISLFLILSLFCFLISDIMYFNDASRHISYEIKDAIIEAKGLFGTVLQKYLDLFIIGLITIIVLGALCFKLLNKNLNAIKFSKSYIPTKFLLITISVFFIRGMFQHIPLDPWHAYKIGNTKLAMLSLNGAYNLVFQNIRNEGDIKITPKYQVNNKLQSVKSLYTNNHQQPLKTSLAQPNIVMFFLESWGGAFLKDYGGEYDITPRFSEILKKSIRPKAMIANGHRTVEGIFSTLTSFQNPLGKSIARTSLQSFEYTSVINLLRERHYSSAFFQGSSSNTAAGNLAQNLGFEHSYGKHDIKKRNYQENYWGVHDPDLYNFVFEKITEMKTPFVIGVNGTTTHDDVVPKNYPQKRFTEDDVLNERLNTFRLSDEATYNFIQKVEKAYPNTIFVILADHTTRIPVDTNFHNYLIPFAIYSPKLKPKYIDEFMSQRDIAPTLTDLVLGDYYKIAPEFSGKSLLRDDNFFADYYHNGVLGVVKNNIAIETVGNQTKCFDVSDFKLNNIICPANTAEITNQIKSFTNLQQELLFKGKTKDFAKFR
ncbi:MULTISPECIES: LTA synthase family protein [Pasteurellaceae]|uniref:Sulfatase-like hydrolase/transferase n=1 Tax=Pasteurella atlantica TaxID=2827233 RepID=A0AAW8CP03_9PAST|nr:alkaline phosphatase family protein [Pasteurella atlantica]MBR0573071.1 sulfatase-like hydrolase/transferase [Pasteurella atlantica]MDP8039072.1 sulfatase-like hydrolase/transferase [Pasteurella atlantica]MDP8041162.1 sulfatase-like hydrolase/transferase [Pasteurella atlantica]MDP8043225.1 sulfatase-like hydrolase/transferase [Pasteurella atlantica]MDP8045311.1 sulfatase-like hydrolase/transferase [Pasteurella atlantica]